MARCEDCLHYDICEIMSDQYGISKVYPTQCGFYKKSADVAPKSEVAREIFNDIAIIGVLQHGFNEKHIVMHIDFELLKELKKKYTEGKE